MGLVVRLSHTRRRARLARGAALRTLRTVPDVRVAIALLFACTLAAPRAPLVYHHHAGGAHAHVHGDAVRSASQRHAAAAGSSGRPAFARDTGPGDGHVHQQQRYHAAVVTAVPFLAVAAPLVAPPAHGDRRAPARVAATASARAPPRSPLV